MSHPLPAKTPLFETMGTFLAMFVATELVRPTLTKCLFLFAETQPDLKHSLCLITKHWPSQ